MAKKSLVYFQSGGPTTVINSSLYGVILEAMSSPEISGIYGARYGVEGLLEDDFVDLREEDPSQFPLLQQTPGAILGSTRKRLPEDGDPAFSRLLATLKRHDVGYVLVNGGNDSMNTCLRLSELFRKENLDIKILGIPKTIDNDLEVTDHALGYPSAARHILNCVKMAVEDSKAYKKGKVVLLEIMGRNAGWLTASVDLLPEGERPDLILLPEMGFSLMSFLEATETIYKRKGNAVIALSEGLGLPRVNNGGCDGFGHRALEGVSVTLAEEIKKATGLSTRAMELSIPQRADPILASKIDVDEAIACGRYAVKQILKGLSGQMVCIRRLSSAPYASAFFLAPVIEIADKEKKIPSSMLQDATRLDDSFREYLRPLVYGFVPIIYDELTYKSAHFVFKKAVAKN